MKILIVGIACLFASSANAYDLKDIDTNHLLMIGAGIDAQIKNIKDAIDHLSGLHISAQNQPTIDAAVKALDNELHDVKAMEDVLQAQVTPQAQKLARESQAEASRIAADAEAKKRAEIEAEVRKHFEIEKTAPTLAPDKEPEK